MRAFKSLGLCLAVALMMSGASGCRRGQAFAGKPALGNGVRVVASSPGRAKGGSFTVALTAFNDTDQRVEANRNQMALVAPDGHESYRQGGREIAWIEARKSTDIALEFDIDAAAFKGAKGAYLRFDGFYVGNVRVDVPPMALGEPTGSPGRTNASFASSGGGAAPAQPAVVSPVGAATDPTAGTTTAQPGVFRRMWAAARGKDAGAPTATATSASSGSSPSPVGATAAPGAAAPTPDAGMQQYRGPRRQLKTPGIKCAAMPMKTKNISAQMAFVVDEILLSELQQSGFEAIGPDDINALIGFEKTKEAVGCDDMGCVSEIGNALGVTYLAAGNVTVVEGSVILTLKLISTKGSKVLARVNKVAEGGQKGLPRVIAEAVQELVERSTL